MSEKLHHNTQASFCLYFSFYDVNEMVFRGFSHYLFIVLSKQSSTSNFLDFPFPVISKKTKQNPILFFSSILHDIPIRSFQMIVCILISDFWNLSDSYDINFLLPNKSGKFISPKKRNLRYDLSFLRWHQVIPKKDEGDRIPLS